MRRLLVGVSLRVLMRPGHAESPSHRPLDAPGPRRTPGGWSVLHYRAGEKRFPFSKN